MGTFRELRREPGMLPLYAARIEDLGPGDFVKGRLRRLPPRRAADAGGPGQDRAEPRGEGAWSDARSQIFDTARGPLSADFFWLIVVGCYRLSKYGRLQLYMRQATHQAFDLIKFS